MSAYPPTLETKRQMLTNAREQFRAKGYEAELNIEALKVQEGFGDENVAKQIDDLSNTAANSYKAARRMDEMLSKLPKPKDEKKK